MSGPLQGLVLSSIRENCFNLSRAEDLGALATDAAGKLDVLGHDGDTLSVNGTQVGVFEETNKVGFGSLLKCHHSRGLEAQVSFEILGDFANKSLEGELADEKLGTLLVASDFTKSYGTRPVPVGLLHAPCGGCGLASCLGGELLARSLASSRFACCLLGASHLVQVLEI